MRRASDYGPDEFRRDTGVSRETLARLAVFAALLVKWNARINLVSASTLPHLWRRHFLDSAQLAPLLPAGAKTLADLGSGAGMPGLVLSIMGAMPFVQLVEADARKAVFLREAVRIVNAQAEVHAQRIEHLKLGAVDVITARALAPLDRFLPLAIRCASIHTVFLIHKGKKLSIELTAARKRWKMRERIVPSRTDPSASILVLTEVTPVHAAG